MKFSDTKPSISVIIPTYNRASLLNHSLESLSQQTLPKDSFEVIVVDDGSTDNTKEICGHFSARLNIKYYYQRKSNIATAKNLGVLVSSAPLTFFFDDDDVADRNLLSEHIKTHEEYPEENIAVLGYTTWHPAMEVTPVMHFVTEIGQMLFAYPNLKHGQILDFSYFWGGRSSCKRSLLVKYGLHNQDFDTYQDIELGYRLAKHGLKVVYNAKAISYMIREVTYKDFCNRCERKGRTLYLFSKLYPNDKYIQAYSQTERAADIWRNAKKYVSFAEEKIKRLEREVPINKTALTELYALYRWLFHAYRIKGIVTAPKEHNQIYEPLLFLKSAENTSWKDSQYFVEKWKDYGKKKKKKILVIDPLLPMFDRASGSLRLFHLLKIFKKIGYHVTFLSIRPDFYQNYVPILQQMGIEVYAGDPDVLNEGSPVYLLPDPNLEELLSKENFDIVILDFWHTAKRYLPLIRRLSPSSKIIIDTVDIHFVREKRRAEVSKDSKLMQRFQKIKEEEIKIYKKADRLWVVTEEDGRAIRDETFPIPIDVIPNIHEEREDIKSYEKTSDLIFVGNFTHSPNVDGIIYFVKEIFPLITKKLPEVKLYIVGNAPPVEVSSLSSSRIIVTGYVNDLSPYLIKARIFVSPLTYGAGMKGKIGEALSYGLPVVTTSIGAEGMSLIHGEDVLIADNPEDFTHHVVTLYEDKKLWERISSLGKRKVESLWSPREAERRVRHVFSLMEKPIEERLTSIIVLTYNGLNYTKRCIESIFRHTEEPFELIIVDNGSKDDTCKYVTELINDLYPHSANDEAKTRMGKILNPRVSLIKNEKNLGYAAGNNRGLLSAIGDYLVIINNDVVVTPKWLSKLIQTAEKSYKTGIVGPMTNYVTGPQLVTSIGYDGSTLNNLDAFAESFGQKSEHKIIPAWKVVGFCMLVKREVIEKIGGFDERFGLGNFEDDDFCLRAKLAGYDSVIAGNCFVHHFGGRTFTGEKIDYQESLRRNWEIFKRKWGLPADLAYGTPYDVRMILNRPFSQDLHYVPLKPEEYNSSLAERLFEKGDSTGAIFCLKKILEHDPNNAEALNGLGYIAFAEGKVAEAISWFERGLKVDPDNTDILENMGQLHAGRGEFDQAIPYLQKALEKKPDNVELLNSLANCFVQMGAYLEAETLYRKSYQIDENQEHVKEILGLFEGLKKQDSMGLS